MVRLALDGPALARVRFTTSPLWETGLSALVLRSPHPGPVHARWVERTRAAVAPEVLGRVMALTAGRTFVLDALTPSGEQPLTGGLDTELERLARLDRSQLQRDLTALAGLNRGATGEGHAWVRRLAASHGPTHAELAAVIRAYWDGALAPHWGRFTRLVEEDTSLHGRAATHGGAVVMLEGLHPRVRFTGDALDIPGACEASTEEADPSGGVLLVPSAFAWPDVHVQPNAPYQPAIAYGVRGLGTLWDDDAGPDDHLTRLLGDGRARVLRGLSAPATTHELSHDLGLSPSTVNAHLQALAGSHLARAVREGRRVVYHLTDTGRALVG